MKLLRCPTAIALILATAWADPRPAKGEALVRLAQRWRVSAVAVAIVHDDRKPEFIFHGTTRSGKKVDADTLFGIGSIAKGLTSTVVASCVADGVLDWSAPAARYIPDLDPSTFKLTLLDCIGSRSGLERCDMLWFVDSRRSRSDLLGRIAGLERCSEPGIYTYSNVLYLPVAEAVERATGRSFEQELDARVLDPLGMRRTTMSFERASEEANVAVPTSLVNGRVRKIPWVDRSSMAPALAMWSSCGDLAKWMSWLLGATDGPADADESLAGVDPRRLFEPCTLIRQSDSGKTEYARGCMRRSGDDDLSLWWLGNGDGWTAMMVMRPGTRGGFVALANVDEASFLEAAVDVLGDPLELGFPASADELSSAIERLNAGRRKRMRQVRKCDVPLEPDIARRCTGGFRHPAVGKASVRYVDGSLVLSLGELEGTLLDLVVGKGIYGVIDWKQESLSDSYVRFYRSYTGEVTRVQVDVDQVGDATFDRIR